MKAKITTTLFSSLLALSLGAQWQNTNCPTQYSAAYDMVVDNNQLLAATPRGIFKTADGTTWTDAFSGITVTSGFTFTQSLKKFDNVLYSGTNGSNLYTSTDGGANWTLLGGRSGLFSVKITSIFKNGSTFLYGCDGNGGTQYSTNGGTSWSGSSYPTGSDINNSVGYDVVELNGVLYSCSYKNVFRSTDGGLNWENITTAPTISSVQTSLCAINGGLLLSIYGDGVHRSTDGGASWTKVLGGSLGTKSNNITRVHFENNIAFAGGALGQIHQSNDNGVSWTDITDTGIGMTEVVQSIRIFNSDIYVGTNVAVYNKNINTAELPDYEKVKQLKVYPNPAQNLIHVSGIDFGTKVMLHDLNGKMLRGWVMNGENFSLDGIQAGAYLLKTETGNETIIYIH